MNPPEINLHDRRVLVTGAARGLGESFARALVAAGARVVIRDVLHERGQALAAEIGARYVAMDLSEPAAITAGMAKVVACYDGLDGLVNNAAITDSGGQAARVASQVPRTLTAITLSQVSVLNSSSVLPPELVIAALLTRPSRPSKQAAASATPASTAAGSLKSIAT